MFRTGQILLLPLVISAQSETPAAAATTELQPGDFSTPEPIVATEAPFVFPNRTDVCFYSRTYLQGIETCFAINNCVSYPIPSLGIGCKWNGFNSVRFSHMRDLRVYMTGVDQAGPDKETLSGASVPVEEAIIAFRMFPETQTNGVINVITSETSDTIPLSIKQQEKLTYWRGFD